jgi:hypothetical protein
MLDCCALQEVQTYAAHVVVLQYNRVRCITAPTLLTCCTDVYVTVCANIPPPTHGCCLQ